MTSDTAVRTPAPRWAAVAILGLTGLLYAYALWNAVAFLIEHSTGGLSLYGWFVLIFAILFPLIAFAIVYAIGNGRGALELFLVAIAGLGVVAVFWLNVVAHFAASPTLFAA
ncbi:bacitracin resistance protein [Microbacterium sp. NIBRBAC000506063]|uniref:bacitracin resistance protein n=1 Tax=Microbacterium sp. NIBRBAC000506063 TaxID=2734618 RepID=UPI001BB56B7A|nr:bacitracin resistance protein [Microbacterium sp. NIBRBAC000506063]QTV79618.1 bacitracin resistance protein [Microbacterium sp. NIBRBAC000506063]